MATKNTPTTPIVENQESQNVLSNVENPTEGTQESTKSKVMRYLLALQLAIGGTGVAMAGDLPKDMSNKSPDAKELVVNQNAEQNIKGLFNSTFEAEDASDTNNEFDKLSVENKTRIINYYNTLFELHDVKSKGDLNGKKIKLLRSLSYMISLAHNTEVTDAHNKKWVEGDRDIDNIEVPDTAPSYLVKQVLKYNPNASVFLMDQNFNEGYFNVISNTFNQIVFEKLKLLKEESDRLVKEHNELETEKSELEAKKSELEAKKSELEAKLKKIKSDIELLNKFLSYK